jgi:hypothetical protein
VRYTSQHYNPGSAISTLAGSILADRERLQLGHVDDAAIGGWIRQNIDPVHFLMGERIGVPVSPCWRVSFSAGSSPGTKVSRASEYNNRMGSSTATSSAPE